MSTSSSSDPKTLHLVGIGVTHSIAPPMHTHIAQSLGLPWTFHSTECATLDDLMTLARSPDTQGLVVTMPYKASIMPRLDALDPLATTLGACNNVYRDPKNPNILRGTNTDWRGIKGCLLEKNLLPPSPLHSTHTNINHNAQKFPPSLIIGAGGASRAALYALSTELHSPEIYILNRDAQEVASLIQDSLRLPDPPSITHITSLSQARSLATPFYIVGTVPDYAPQTPSEILVHEILIEFLSRPSSFDSGSASASASAPVSTTSPQKEQEENKKGILLDMCFKPRRTRTIKLAEQHGWATVEGTHVIMYQIEEQWRLWAGQELVEKKLDKEEAWKVLLKAAEESKGINF